jgi:hypothetical protein
MAETVPATAGAAPRPEATERLVRRMRSPLLRRGFFLAKLPLALVAGLKVDELSPARAATSVPYGWRTTNPFRSTYFAALSMAAELATGALGMLAAETAREPVAMLIVGMTASFEKKATGRTTFVCEDGALAAAVVESTLRTGEPATVEMTAIGTLADGTVVARFTFTWSFKVRRRQGAAPRTAAR